MSFSLGQIALSSMSSICASTERRALIRPRDSETAYWLPAWSMLAWFASFWAVSCTHCLSASHLFGVMAQAVEYMEQGNIISAYECLVKAQLEAEEACLESDILPEQ